MKSFAKTTRAVAEDAETRAVGGGVGGVTPGVVQHAVVHINLAAIQDEVSGVPFGIAAFVPNVRLLGIEIQRIQDLAGTGPMTAAHIEIGSSADAAPDSVMGSTDVFTGAALGFATTPGSNPYQSRGGQTINATITAIGGTLANATAGSIDVGYYYVIEP